MNRFGLFVACLLALGCSSEAEKGRVPVFPVTGKVTMFGSPLGSATVAFAPSNGQPTAIGTTDDAGNFKLTTYEFGDGAAEGSYRVVISKAISTSSGNAATDSHGDNYVDSAAKSHGDDSGAAGEKLVPAQYTTSSDTPLNAEVKPGGENTFTFEIK